MTTRPPEYYTTVPTLYDETHRGKWYMSATVNSMGNSPNLLGYLEHHDPASDGSFAICVANGDVTLVNKKLYESIPAAHRPPLDTKGKNMTIDFALFGGKSKALGSTIIPIILTDGETGKRFRIKLYTLVMEDLLMGMFIGLQDKRIFARSGWNNGHMQHGLDFGDGKIITLEGL